MNFQASVSTDSAWLTLATAPGQTAPNNPTAISATVNPAGLSTGVYRGVVHLDSEGVAPTFRFRWWWGHRVRARIEFHGPAVSGAARERRFQHAQRPGVEYWNGPSNWQTDLLSGGE
jgi:hypothetical protein